MWGCALVLAFLAAPPVLRALLPHTAILPAWLVTVATLATLAALSLAWRLFRR